MTEQTDTLTPPSEFDALPKLRPGEPYFALIGRDRLAPGLVCSWADQNRRRALADFETGQISRDQLELELRQSTEAEMKAAEMRSYKAGWSADQEKGQGRLSYVGSELPEDTAKRDRLQAARARAVGAIQNAIAEVTDLVTLLDAEWSDDAALADLANIARDNVEDMKLVAEEATPKRPDAVKAAA